MRFDVLELDNAVSRILPDLTVHLADAEALRLMLSGGSVIDWHKAAFSSHEQVDQLLELHQIDETGADRGRTRYVFNEAVAYLEEHLRVRVPADMRNPDDVRDIFLIASDTSGFRRRQVVACMILKLMHVMHHLEAADLKHRTAISEQALLDLAYAYVTSKAHEMRSSGLPLVAFHGSRKTRTSVVSKLLAKRDNVATTIFDKLRFRIIVPEPQDLVPTLVWLSRNVFPFNHTIPGQSHNNLLDPRRLEAMLDDAERDDLQQDISGVRKRSTKNEFSGRSYRMINFIADIPVRLPDDVIDPGRRLTNGRVVYVMVEFQVVDKATADTNETGENAHELYKRRQADRVETRLMRGTYVK
jgi:uncharacterized protein (TIGR04552 family)